MTALLAALYLVLHERRCLNENECLRCEAPAPFIVLFAGVDASLQIAGAWQSLFPGACG